MIKTKNIDIKDYFIIFLLIHGKIYKTGEKRILKDRID